MSETHFNHSTHVFAFYLPQFYPMPLNSRWWGEGFTEWSAVLQAQRGRRSPRDTTLSPGQLGFYDLRLRESRLQQGEIAREHGLGSFCIYHYYSRGDRVMPEVVDRILKDGAPDFPFFFCWANHDWNLSWQGRPDVVTWKQEYEDTDDDSHYNWLREAFNDPRYLKIGNSPVIAIYDVNSIPNSAAVISRWKTLAVRDGHAGLVVLAFAHRHPLPTAKSAGIDAWVQGSALSSVSTFRRVVPSLRSFGAAKRFLIHGDYRIERSRLSRWSAAQRRKTRETMIPTVMTSWNNVGRRSKRATYIAADPELFELELKSAFSASAVIAGPSESVSMVAINAWNEWGETMTLEPTREHGAAMLEVLRRVIGQVG